MPSLELLEALGVSRINFWSLGVELVGREAGIPELHLHCDVGSIDDEGLTTGNALSVDALAGASADALADSLTSFFGVGLESKPEKRLVSDL